MKLLMSFIPCVTAMSSGLKNRAFNLTLDSVSRCRCKASLTNRIRTKCYLYVLKPKRQNCILPFRRHTFLILAFKLLLPPCVALLHSTRRE